MEQEGARERCGKNGCTNMLGALNTKALLESCSNSSRTENRRSIHGRKTVHRMIFNLHVEAAHVLDFHSQEVVGGGRVPSVIAKEVSTCPCPRPRAGRCPCPSPHGTSQMSPLLGPRLFQWRSQPGLIGVLVSSLTKLANGHLAVELSSQMGVGALHGRNDLQNHH